MVNILSGFILGMCVGLFFQSCAGPLASYLFRRALIRQGDILLKSMEKAQSIEQLMEQSRLGEPLRTAQMDRNELN